MPITKITKDHRGEPKLTLSEYQASDTNPYHEPAGSPIGGQFANAPASTLKEQGEKWAEQRLKRSEPVEENFLEKLSEDQREKVFAEMRAIGADAESYSQQYMQLAPRGGEIPVGGAHFDAFLQSETRHEFLRGLRKGNSPKVAAEKTKSFVREAVAKHNSQRRDWQRSEGMMDPTINYLQQRVERVMFTGTAYTPGERVPSNAAVGAAAHAKK